MLAHDHVAVHRGLLFASDLVEIRDNACNRSDPDLSPETAPMPYHEIVFGRTGLWCRHEGRRALPVDAHHVHFFTRGASHRVSHPAGCGDYNTGLTVEPNTLAAIARQCRPDASFEAPFPATHRPVDHRTLTAHRLLLAAVRATTTRALEPLAIEELTLLGFHQARRGALRRQAPQPLVMVAASRRPRSARS